MEKGRKDKDPSSPVKIPIEGVLDLHTFHPGDVPNLLEEYLKECLEARIYSVRVVHGKGKGIQKHRVQGLLQRLPMVASFSDAPVSAGGWGATIVELKREKDLPSPESAEFSEYMTEGARAMGVHLDAAQMEKFAVHARELLEWNRSANLTAITDPNEMAEKLFLDTLPLVSLLPPDSRVLDIGSGGGFPGLPLKVMRPDLGLCLIEASRKKTSFLKHVIRTLGLKNIEARHVRAEDLAKEVQAGGNAYDVIVSKAAFKLERLLDHALPLLHRQGSIIAMKGMPVKAELETIRLRLRTEGFTAQVKPYRLPRLDIQRSLVLLERT